MKYLQLYFLLIATAFSCQETRAQKKIIISGVVKDKQQQAFLVGANILLCYTKDSVIAASARSDSSGMFAVQTGTNGNYFLRISYSGFEELMYENIDVHENDADLNLGVLILTPVSGNTLGEVKITAARKQAVQLLPGKKVFTADHQLAATGSSATELLQQIPFVQVNAAGEITVRGSEHISILIDGKPSLIGAGSIAQLLQSLPANSIDKIELITNGGARYSAEGDAAIINIILKKNYRKGINGSVSAGIGSRDNENASANFSFQKSTFNSYINYSFQHVNTFSTGFQHLTSLIVPVSIKYSDQIFPSVTLNNIHDLKGSIDYSLTGRTRLSFSSGYNSNSSNRKEALKIDEYADDHTGLRSGTHNNHINGIAKSFNANVDIIQTFKKHNEELLISTGYAQGSIRSHLLFKSDTKNLTAPNIGDISQVRRNEIATDNNYYNLKVDYSVPSGKQGLFETGLWLQWRANHRNLQADSLQQSSGRYLQDNTLINFYKNKNYTYAVYINYKLVVGKSDIQFGFRSEYSRLRGTVTGFDSASAKYDLPVAWLLRRIYPSFSYRYKWNNYSQAYFSYARRVVSPSPRNLNPLFDASDPSNYERGNPGLLPENVQSVEMGYIHTFSTNSLSATLYFRQTNNLIRRVQTAVTDGRTTTLTVNFPSSHVAGLECLLSLKKNKKWENLFSVAVFHNYTSSFPSFGINKSAKMAITAGVTSTLTILKRMVVQLYSSYSSANFIAQDQNKYTWSADGGLSYSLFKQKASINFAARDIFKTRYRRFVRVSSLLLLDFERISYSDRFSFTFSFRFGGTGFKVKKIEHSSEKQEN